MPLELPQPCIVAIAAGREATELQAVPFHDSTVARSTELSFPPHIVASESEAPNIAWFLLFSFNVAEFVVHELPL